MPRKVILQLKVVWIFPKWRNLLRTLEFVAIHFSYTISSSILLEKGQLLFSPDFLSCPLGFGIPEGWS